MHTYGEAEYDILTFCKDKGNTEYPHVMGKNMKLNCEEVDCKDVN
jgi:hypothetical protein